MKVLVCGGRTYSNQAKLFAALDLYKDIELVITGEANGADNLARRWAYQNGIPCMVFPAAWTKYGKGAGPIRNGWMLKWGKPDLVVAAPGGRGTSNMIVQALRYGVPVDEVAL